MKKIATLLIIILCMMSYNMIGYADYNIISYRNDKDTKGVAYSGNVCVVISNEQILVSNDFLTWESTLYSEYNTHFNQVFWLLDRFWVVQYNNDDSEVYKFLYSMNGYDWIEFPVSLGGTLKFMKLSQNRDELFIRLSNESRPYIKTRDMVNFEEISHNEYSNAIDFTFSKHTEYNEVSISCNGLKIIYNDGQTKNEYYIPEYPNIQDMQYPFAYTRSGSVVVINDKEFVVNRYLNPRANASIVPYSEIAYNFFASEIKRNYPLDYIFTDNGYMANVVNIQGYDRMDLANSYNTVYFYDKNCNLIKEQTFDGCVRTIYFSDGTYYVYVIKYGERYSINANKSISESWLKSTDMEIWEECEEPKKNHEIGNVYHIEGLGTTFVAKNNKEYSVIYENKFYENSEDICNFKYKITDDVFAFSNDGIYFSKTDLPDEFKMVADNYMQSQSSEIRYDKLSDVLLTEQGDNIMLCTPLMAIVIPREDIYDNIMNDAPYIVLDNKLLAFETAPVIEDGNTLVPMRFLFEQMGADVEWNQETQTATATLNNTAVTFSIDDTEASVNNAPTTMDVPARLINDKTMVPLRFLSEEMGYTVTWDDASRTAIIE